MLKKLLNFAALSLEPRAKRSFTLIELMLVVIIIGILAATVMPRFVGQSERARKAAAKVDIATVSNALDRYEMDMGKYPDALDELITAPADKGNWQGPYLKKKPKDPWGKDYKFTKPGKDNRDYDLCSGGGGEEGKTENAICNE